MLCENFGVSLLLPALLLCPPPRIAKALTAEAPRAATGFNSVATSQTIPATDTGT